MAALIRRFRTFPEPQPPAELLSNAAANERVPWWRRGGMGLFEHGALLTEFVPAIVLQYHLVYCDTLLLRVAAATLSFASFREGIKTGDGSVVASILMPLYFLTVAFGVLLPRPLVTIGAAFLLAGVKLGVCMSVCLHRWAAHGAFSCSYPFAVVLSVLGCLATQGGPVWWGSKHRVHHAYCEKARDPHSPRWRGLIGAFAWFGKENKYVDLEHVPLHLEGTLLLLIDTYSFLPTLAELACAYRYFGVTGLYISYVAGALCKVGSLWFNVTNHPPEQRVDRRGCGAVDDVHKEALQTPNVFFAMVQEVTWPYTFLIGEAAHDHHHVHPALAHRPGGVDLPYYFFIRPLEACGLVWGVKHKRAEHKWEGATGGSKKDTLSSHSVRSRRG